MPVTFMKDIVPTKHYRALIFTVYGPETDKEWDGKKIRESVKVVFDRYGLNKNVYDGRTNEEAFNFAISCALAGAYREKGTWWKIHHYDIMATD